VDHALTISDFADQAVILPLAAGTGLLLAMSGWRRGAVAWILAIGTTLGLIVLLKLRFFACEGSNPSGHTAAAAAVYGGLAGLLVAAIRHDIRGAVVCAIVVGASFAVVIGQSRLMLDRHSLAEVMIGGAIGIGGAAGFVAFAGAPAPATRIGAIVALGLILVLLLHGVRLSAEETIKSMASQFWPLTQCLRQAEQGRFDRQHAPPTAAVASHPAGR
jgi:membrane-associated phospholipid phosphatase